MKIEKKVTNTVYHKISFSLKDFIKLIQKNSDHIGILIPENSNISIHSDDGLCAWAIEDSKNIVIEFTQTSEIKER